MTLSSNPHAYKDVKAVLDTALANGGGEYVCSTPGEAVHWRMRAYKYRQLVMAKATEPTPYDMLFLQLNGNSVFIRQRTIKGKLKPLPEEERTQPPLMPREAEKMTEEELINAALGLLPKDDK